MGTASVACRVLCGAPAVEALQDSARTAQWESLLATSRSATVYQSPAFAHRWWRAYGDLHELAIADAVGPRDELRGQFLVVRARDRRSVWAPLGLHQCEYPAVLARDDDPSLVSRILRTAQVTLDLAQLKFLFLPPRAPLDGYITTGASYARPHPRPLRHFATAKSPGKRSKEKLSKLRRLGARLAVFRAINDVRAFLDQFMPMHDARQRDLGREAPFTADPRKRDFVASLAGDDAPILHTAGLFLGDRLIAGLVALQNGPALVLSQLAHEPEFEDLSPVACLVHLLPASYEHSPVTTLDLTPGGDYKNRFAAEYDTAYALDVAWSPLPRARLIAHRELGGLVRRFRRG